LGVCPRLVSSREVSETGVEPGSILSALAISQTNMAQHFKRHQSMAFKYFDVFHSSELLFNYPDTAILVE